MESLIMEFRAIDLRGHIPGGAAIEFLRAEVPSGQYHGPFAVIHYALQGVEQDLGLRLDMDKQVFLDHFEDEEREEIIQKAAPEIVDFLGSILYTVEV
jgi:hypothetical protein